MACVSRCYNKDIKNEFTRDETREIGKVIDVDFSKYDLEQFQKGFGDEMKHDSHDQETNELLN